MGHLSLEALVRAKDLKGRDESDAGQDHTNQAPAPAARQGSQSCTWAKGSSQHSIGTWDVRATPAGQDGTQMCPRH